MSHKEYTQAVYKNDALVHDAACEVDAFLMRAEESAKTLKVPADQRASFLGSYINACATIHSAKWQRYGIDKIAAEIGTGLNEIAAVMLRQSGSLTADALNNLSTSIDQLAEATAGGD